MLVQRDLVAGGYFDYLMHDPRSVRHFVLSLTSDYALDKEIALDMPVVSANKSCGVVVKEAVRLTKLANDLCGNATKVDFWSLAVSLKRRVF